MSTSSCLTSRHDPYKLVALFLLSCLFSAQLAADDATPEHARLDAVLRQIDTIERLIAEETARSHSEQSRYYFDYVRLKEDLERMRRGIHDYLAPARAQPRDPVELTGEYRQSTHPIPFAEDTP
jgi:RAQPRD family integrative conjugative element protein